MATWPHCSHGRNHSVAMGHGPWAMGHGSTGQRPHSVVAAKDVIAQVVAAKDVIAQVRDLQEVQERVLALPRHLTGAA